MFKLIEVDLQDYHLQEHHNHPLEKHNMKNVEHVKSACEETDCVVEKNNWVRAFEYQSVERSVFWFQSLLGGMQMKEVWHFIQHTCNSIWIKMFQTWTWCFYDFSKKKCTWLWRCAFISHEQTYEHVGQHKKSVYGIELEPNQPVLCSPSIIYYSRNLVHWQYSLTKHDIP